MPLFLHLFNLRQPRTVDFSSLAFVKEVQESAVQRVRIKEWLLLALRMLAIASLVLAFAQPTLTAGIAGLDSSVRTAYGLVMDNSLSMSGDSRQGGTGLDRAQARGRDVIRTVEDGDEIVVWPTARGGEGEPTLGTNVGVAEQALSTLEARAGGTSLGRAAIEAAQLVDESDAGRKVVYLVSDLQQSALGDSVAVTVPDDVGIHLLPIDRRELANVAITDVTVRSRITEVGEPVQLEATLINYGSSPISDHVASVYLKGERVAQATSDLEPGLETTVSFTITPQERGWLRGRVQTGADEFPADDEHHFTLHVPEVRRVLVVRGEAQDTRYVDLALSSEMVSEGVSFRTTSIQEEALPSTDLGTHDVVLLVGPRSLSSGAVESLVRYVDRGGGVFLFPSDRAQPATYNPFLQKVGAGTIRGTSGSADTRQPIASVERVDLEHPLFEGVFRQEGQSDAEVERPDISRTMNLQPSGTSGHTLIELSNGVPFLHEVRHGNGGMLWMAVAPTPEWSDLPVRGLFVPLLYRSVYYLSAGASAAGEQLVAGQPGDVHVTGWGPGTTLRLVGPNGTERVPEQRSLFGAILLEVGRSLHDPGIYDVRADEDLVRRVAVNVDPAESDLRTSTPDSAAAILQRTLGTSVSTLAGPEQADVTATIDAQRAGTEVWSVFLLLALLFLVAEMLVASQWRPETAAS